MEVAVPSSVSNVSTQFSELEQLHTEIDSLTKLWILYSKVTNPYPTLLLLTFTESSPPTTQANGEHYAMLVQTEIQRLHPKMQASLLKVR